MARKIFSGILIGLSSLLLLASLVGIVLAWVYNEPLTREWTGRLTEVEAILSEIHGEITIAQTEVERALRILDSAEAALTSLTQQTADASSILEDVSATLDDQLLPGLQSTRDSITNVRSTLEDMRASLEELNSLPFVELNVPGDDLLASLLAGLDTLDAEVANVEDLAQRASTFVSDTSYLLGGDFSETRTNLESLLATLKKYEVQVADWQEQVATIAQSLPGWIDRASIYLTLFLLWFGFSQFGLFLHGLRLWWGEDPLDVLRRLWVKPNPPAG